LTVTLTLFWISFRNQCLCKVSYTTDIAETIGYQIHSWNDLREWPQGFMKGMEWIKVDPNYVGPSFCQFQEHVRNKSDQRGCLLLSHDNPNENKTDYNSLDDILDFLMDPINARFLKSPSRRIVIALCFKSISPCENSTVSKNWASLVDEFFMRSNHIISNFALNVEFILDGSGAPEGCLVDRWRPWVSTWIDTDNPVIALFSNDASQGYDRFQVLNEQVLEDNPKLNIEMMAFLDYGKFSNQTKYPYVNWEPRDENNIQAVIDVYLRKSILAVASISICRIFF